MTISELIQILDGIQDKHGDLPVERADGTEVIGVYSAFEEGVTYDAQAGVFPPVVAVTIK